MTVASDRRQRDLLIVGGVLGLHVLVLAPLALRQAATNETAVPTVFDITLERPPRPTRPIEFAASDTPSPAAAHSASPQAWTRANPSDPTPGVPVQPSPQAQVDDRWRVQPHFVRPGDVRAPRRIAGDCLDLLEDRPQCRTFGAPLRTIDAELPDETAASRARAADRRRDDGFERQVRANEAWRDYTRGEGAYPGLRSMLSER